MRNEASHEIRHQYLERAKARQRARLDAAVHARRGARADHRLVPRLPRGAIDVTAARLPLLRRAPALEPVLSLGDTPLANALLTARRNSVDAEPTGIPLDLAFCPAARSSRSPRPCRRSAVPRLRLLLVVLGHDAAARARRSPSELVARARARARQPGRRGRQQRRLPAAVLPARRASRCSASSRRATSPRSREERGIRTIAEFFGADAGRAARRRRATRADVIHANNVLAHVADLNGFVAGISALLKPDGVAVIEVPYVKDLLDSVRVRHDLPRAPLLLLADRARRAVRSATA